MAKATLVVMAAGIGSRYGGLKQIDPIGPNGEIVIDYAVYDAIKAGFDKVVFIIRNDIKEAFKEKVGRAIEKQVETAYVYQELDKIPAGFSVPEGRTKPWGTAHAILCCQDAVDGVFAVINADDFYGRSAYQVLSDYLKQAQDKDGIYDYSVVGYILNKTLSDHGHVARGVCNVNDQGLLTGITERIKIQRLEHGRVAYSEDDQNWLDISETSIVSMNMWGFTPSLFKEIEGRLTAFLKEKINVPKSEYLLPDVVGELIKENKAKVKVLPTEEKWFGVTYKEDLAKVQESIQALIEAGLYPAKLWQENSSPTKGGSS